MRLVLISVLALEETVVLVSSNRASGTYLKSNKLKSQRFLDPDPDPGDGT